MSWGISAFKLWFRGLTYWNVIYMMWVLKKYICQSHWLHALKHGSPPLEYWDYGFESCSRCGCLSLSFCVVLSCGGKSLLSDWSPVQCFLPMSNWFIISELILSWKRTQGLIHKNCVCVSHKILKLYTLSYNHYANVPFIHYITHLFINHMMPGAVF